MYRFSSPSLQCRVLFEYICPRRMRNCLFELPTFPFLILRSQPPHSLRSYPSCLKGLPPLAFADPVFFLHFAVHSPVPVLLWHRPRNRLFPGLCAGVFVLETVCLLPPPARFTGLVLVSASVVSPGSLTLFFRSFG